MRAVAGRRDDAGMAKPRLDELESQKLGPTGARQSERTDKEVARALFEEARRALPDGLAERSPYRTLTASEIVQEAAHFGFKLGQWLTEDELRLVTEYLAVRAKQAVTRRPSAPPEPVPMQPAAPVKIRGIRPSASNTWRVILPTDRPRTLSVGGGQMATLRNGTTVCANHYTREILQSFVDQGLKLVPIEEEIAEDMA